MRDGKLEFKDAPMFSRVMRDPEICKGVLERILGFAVERIEYVNAEQDLDAATGARGVRLDVFAKGSGRAFDVEMQVAWHPSLGKRMRYYQAAIDQACLGKGDAYGDLAESYVVFICDFDAYGRGLPAYHLERMCAEDLSVDPADGSHWLVLNAPAWAAEEDAGRARLLQYVHEGAPGDDRLTERIDAAVARTNEDAAWRESAMGFMTVEYSHRCDLDGAREEGLQAGLQEGLQQGQAQANARYSALVDVLLDAGRADDLKRAANDPAFRERLFQEFHIA